MQRPRARAQAMLPSRGCALTLYLLPGAVTATFAERLVPCEYRSRAISSEAALLPVAAQCCPREWSTGRSADSLAERLRQRPAPRNWQPAQYCRLAILSLPAR